MKTFLLLCMIVTGCYGWALAETAPQQPAVQEGETAAEKPAGEDGWESLLHGIRFRELDEGDGKEPALWAAVYVHYRLVAENGTVLEDTYSSESHGRRARKHVIGSGTMPEALELAVASMRERGRRELMIPADLFSVSDFHTHDDEDAHNDEEHNKLVTALQPGTAVKAEVSLLWVRPYDPSNFNRFQ